MLPESTLTQGWHCSVDKDVRPRAKGPGVSRSRGAISKDFTEVQIQGHESWVIVIAFVFHESLLHTYLLIQLVGFSNQCTSTLFLDTLFLPSSPLSQYGPSRLGPSSEVNQWTCKTESSRHLPPVFQHCMFNDEKLLRSACFCLFGVTVQNEPFLQPPPMWIYRSKLKSKKTSLDHKNIARWCVKWSFRMFSPTPKYIHCAFMWYHLLSFVIMSQLHGFSLLLAAHLAKRPVDSMTLICLPLAIRWDVKVHD